MIIGAGGSTDLNSLPLSRYLRAGGGQSTKLMQILRPLNATRVQTIVLDAANKVITPATAAQLKDGSDATYEIIGMTASAISEELIVDVVWSMDNYVAGGIIQYLYLVNRARFFLGVGAMGGDVITAYPKLGAFIAPVYKSPTGIPFHNDYSDKYVTDPNTGLAWTAAVVNAMAFGWRYDLINDNFNPANFENDQAEFWVEVWGHA